MIFYDNSGYSNAPCCYVIHTVPLVFKFSSSSSCTSSGFSSWPPQLVSPPSLPFHSSIHHSLRILVLSVFSRGWARHLHSSNPKLFFGNSVETFSVGAASPASRRPPKWPSGWLLHASYPTRYSVCLQEGGRHIQHLLYLHIICRILHPSSSNPFTPRCSIVPWRSFSISLYSYPEPSFTFCHLFP